MKHRLIATAALLLWWLAGGACAGGEASTIHRQTIAVSIEPARHLLQGESTVTITGNGVRTASFSLHPGAVVSEVRVEDTGVPVRFSGGVVQVDLPDQVSGRALIIVIRYQAAFDDPRPARIATTEDPTYGVNAVIAPEGVFLGGGVAWYPRPPVQPAQRTLTVTTPPGMEAVSAGMRLERRTATDRNVSIWEERHPVDDLALSAGDYALVESTAEGLPLQAYFSPKNTGLAPAYLEAAGRYLKLYQGLFGPYPFEKFAIVENFLPTGYGYPSYTLLGGEVIRLPFIIGTSLPHEIAHNWWGNGVLVDYSKGNWSEGLATYVADYLLEEKKSAVAAKEYRYRILTDFAALVSPEGDFPLSSFVGRTDPASRSIGYGKGAMVFHMVRKELGDDAFFAALRDLCRNRLYRTASWDDFTAAFSRSAGKDLAPFMSQWLSRRGGPRLALADVAVKPREGQWVLTGTISQAQPHWSVPVDIQVETIRGSVRHRVNVAGAASTFAFPVDQHHGRVMLDPDADLFRLLAPGDIPPAVNSIKGSRRLLGVVSRGCKADRDTVALLMESLGQGRARLVGEDDLNDADLSDNDLLVCGLPRRTALLSSLPATISVDQAGFTVEGTRFASGKDTLFVVSKHPANPQRVVALFLPGSGAAAAASVKKISHYGKYGYSAFSGAENKAKGMMPVVGSGTVAEF